ncbi:MAG: SPASM domain-containing protein [bacterium]|nr:SPASM domain-containing protein [bacterium]
MLHYPELRIGNIHQENIKTLYNESALLKKLRGINVDSLEQCRSCVVRNFCGAGCRARVDIKKSGIRGSDAFCSFERKSIMDALLYSFA